MNSCSLTSSSRWKLTSGGIVASPTPTVPISSDSMSLMSSTLPSVREIAAATIQPAVPPPAMTILRTGLCSTVSPLSVQALQQEGAQVARAIGIELAEHAARILGNVRGLLGRRIENVVVEDRLERRALLRRQIAH